MRTVLAYLSIAGVTLCSSACGGSVQGGSGGASSSSESSSGSSSGNGSSSASGGADGGSCVSAPIGKLCVRGDLDPQTNQEMLTAGGKVRFQMYPKGCYSSSCTVIHEASCAVVGMSGDAITLGGMFCLEDTSQSQPGCTADCSGGGFADCEQAGVAAGQYTATVDKLSVMFQVPSTLPSGGTCVGMQF